MGDACGVKRGCKDGWHAFCWCLVRMAHTGTIIFSETAKDQPDLISRLMRGLFVWLCLQVGQSWAMVAQAEITDQVTFKVPPMIIVWGGGNTSISKGLDAEVRVGNQSEIKPLITGTVLPVRPVLTGLSDRSELDKDQLTWQVSIASNTAFNIDAQWMPFDTSEGQPARITFSWGRVGSAAQSPDSSGSGFAEDIWAVADLNQRQTIFRGDRKSATRAGSIVDQSVELNAVLSGGPKDALRQIAADLEITVYLP